MNEFSVSIATISNWVRQFRDECQINEKANNEYKKILDFVKKAAAFFTKEID